MIKEKQTVKQRQILRDKTYIDGINLKPKMALKCLELILEVVKFVIKFNCILVTVNFRKIMLSGIKICQGLRKKEIFKIALTFM